MTRTEVLEELRHGGPESGFLHCHSRNIHSFVLRTHSDGRLTRLFYAAPGHKLDRLFNADGHFTLGAHNHDKDLTFTILFGNVFQVEVVPGWMKAYRYTFQSALETGQFALGEPQRVGINMDFIPLDGAQMRSWDVHTVLVPSPTAAWLVEETRLDPSREKFIYSPRPDLELKTNGLYYPVKNTPELANWGFRIWKEATEGK